METTHNRPEEHTIPEIYCAISIAFDGAASEASLIAELNEIGITNVNICRPKATSGIILIFAIVNYERSWEINGVISQMFLQINDSISELNMVILKHHAEAYIDIAIIEHGTLPAITISKENTEKIALLGASISIDVS